MTRRQQARRAIADVVGDGPRRVWHEAQSVPVPHEQLGDQLEQIHRLTLEHGTTAAIAVLERAAQLSTDPDKRAAAVAPCCRSRQHAGSCRPRRALQPDAASRHPMSYARRAYADVLRADSPRSAPTSSLPPCATSAQEAIADGDHRSRSTCSWRPRNAPGGSARIEAPRTEIDEVAHAVPGTQDDARRAAIRALAAPIANGRAVSDCLGRVDTALVRDPQALRNFGLAAPRSVIRQQRVGAPRRSRGPVSSRWAPRPAPAGPVRAGRGSARARRLGPSVHAHGRGGRGRGEHRAMEFGRRGHGRPGAGVRLAGKR